MVKSNVVPAATDPLARLRAIETVKRGILWHSAVASAATPTSRQALVNAGAIERVGKGFPLVGQGDPASVIAMIGTGHVRLTRALFDARTLSLGYRGPGDLVGEAAIGGVTAYRETAVATEDVEALLIPVATVRALAAADDAFGDGLLALLVERRGDAEERLASLLFRNVEARLAEFLVKAAQRWGISEPQGVLITTRFTHQEVANLIGATRETVTITLGSLRKRGVIDVDRRRVVVLDRKALEALA